MSSRLPLTGDTGLGGFGPVPGTEGVDGGAGGEVGGGVGRAAEDAAAGAKSCMVASRSFAGMLGWRAAKRASKLMLDADVSEALGVGTFGDGSLGGLGVVVMVN